MKKIFKMCCLLSSFIIPVATCSPIIACKALNSSEVKNNESYILFDGKYFNSIEDATTYAINKYKNIDSDLYIGDAVDAVFDHNTNRLDISKLRLYDQTRIKPAYKNALGEYESSYEKAKKSFINPGLIQYKYDDLNGNLFNSYDEALQSIRHSTERNSVGVYEYVDNSYNKYYINPFNVDDINEFKRISFDDILMRNSNKYKIKIYGESMFNGKEYYSPGILGIFFNEPDAINKMYKDIIKVISNYRNNIVKKGRYCINITLTGNGKGKDYEITNFKQRNYGMTNISSKKVSKKELEFRNISFDELGLFDLYLNRTKFLECHNTDIQHTWIGKEMSEKATTNDEYSKKINCEYELKFVGNDGGGQNGVDIRILTPGSDEVKNSMLTFRVRLRMDNYDVLFKEFKNNIYDLLIKHFDKKYGISSSGSNNKKIPRDSLEFEIIEKIIRSIISYVNANLYNGAKTNYFIGNDNTWDLLNSLNGVPESFGKFSEYVDPNCYLTRLEKDSKNSINKYFESLISNDIVSKLKEFKHKYKLVIEYNESPLWMINEDILKSSKIKIPFNVNSNSILDIENVLNFLTKNNFGDFNFINSLFINVSNNNLAYNKQIFHGLIFDESLRDNDFFECDNKKFKNYMNVNNNKICEEEILETSLGISKNTYYNIKNAAYWYNKYIDSTENLDENKNKITSANNILLLNNENKRQQPIKYKEYLGPKNSFNSSICASNRVVYDSEEAIQLAINNSGLLEPSKVIIMYDLLGSIINPGVVLSEDEKLQSSNDAIYDSENNIIDNLLRTKVIKNDTNKIFYVDQDGSEILLKNDSKLIYFVKWKGRIYYFLNYESAWNYMRDIVEMQSITIIK